MQIQPEIQTNLIPPPIKNQKEKRSNALGIALALLLAFGAFFSGFQINGILSQDKQTANIFSIFASEKDIPTPTENIDLEKFWEVWGLLDEKFTSASSTLKISDEDKINGAIKGMVRSFGDPYTVYMPPTESEAFNEDISGNFSGIGMEVGMRDNTITVISPLPDTPAERAGLISGDLIIKIDDISTDGMSIDDAVRKIRGEKGTSVNLTVFRKGDTEFRKFDVVRDTIIIPTVKTEVKGNVFVLKIFSFNAVAEMKTQEALREFVNSKADTLVLDLRGNPGGYLQSAVAISSFFLPTGKVVVREHFNEHEEEKLYRSSGKTFREFGKKKMIVLIDNGSASASEILAGALKEHEAATIIGTNSFGKGSVQELVDLPSGGALKVTVARWLTPNGLSISDGGLKPDIYINRTPKQRLENIDPQLDAAVDFLHGKEVKSEEAIKE